MDLEARSLGGSAFNELDKFCALRLIWAMCCGSSIKLLVHLTRLEIETRTHPITPKFPAKGLRCEGGPTQSSETESNGQSELMKLLHANRSFCCILTSIKRFIQTAILSDFPLAAGNAFRIFIYARLNIASRTFCILRICINNSCQFPAIFSLSVFSFTE